jgi:hypothetical protein
VGEGQGKRNRVGSAFLGAKFGKKAEPNTRKLTADRTLVDFDGTGRTTQDSRNISYRRKQKKGEINFFLHLLVLALHSMIQIKLNIKIKNYKIEL